MDWISMAVSFVCAVAGGCIAGFVVAFRMGEKWGTEIQGLKSRVHMNEERLQKGDSRVGLVPILQERIDIIVQDVREIKKMIRDGFGRFQTKDMCEEKHRGLER